MIFAEYASPIPGSAFKSASLAVLMSSFPAFAGLLASVFVFVSGFAGAFFGALCGAAASANAAIKIKRYFASVFILRILPVIDFNPAVP